MTIDDMKIINIADARNATNPELRDLDIRAPRYTSYPTADQFHENFTANDYSNHLTSRDQTDSAPLSVYVHIPFCESLCFYCACNKTVTQFRNKAEKYVHSLLDELALVNDQLGGSRSVVQMHWGGGTPTFLNGNEIASLMQGLRTCFDFESDAELSIEIDPRTIKEGRLHQLATEGFNRLSLGVQDFDVDVQLAINRVQSVEMVQRVLNDSRSLGFDSINFDLIYGLPRQTQESFKRTVENVVSMQPNRISLYNYAHLPERFPAQRLILDNELPDAAEKNRIFDLANKIFDEAGYVYIGMDHYALPDDELAIAYRSGNLQRNFQGYSTLPDCDLVSLGASAISRIGNCYAQNLRGVREYSDQISQGILATVRGIELHADDLIRHELIMSIMCQGEVIKTCFNNKWQMNFDEYFHNELIELRNYEALGLLELKPDEIRITSRGRRKALRAICAVFDRYLNQGSSRTAFSRVL